jgi:hypothetical protein
MGDFEKEDYERLRKRYLKLYLGSKLETKKEEGYHVKLRRYGGLFTEPMRNGLLDVERKAGRDRKNINFWYDVRKTIKTGLIDLHLFLEVADDKNIKMTLNREKVMPVVRALFFPYSIQESPKQSAERAKIAQLLVEVGFEYLRKSTFLFIDSTQERKIDDAINVSKRLTALLLPENERVAFLRSGKL